MTRTTRTLLATAVVVALAAPWLSQRLTGQGTAPPAGEQKAKEPVRRLPDGKPDISGHYQSDGGGCHW